MHLINGTNYLNINFLILFFAAAPATALFKTVIVFLTSTCTSLQLHKLDINIEILNLI